ncbi:MAG: T9SS type A sorting domain-containing protein [Aureispira sp.]
MKLLLSIIILLTIAKSYAQTTFNKRIQLGCGTTIFTGLEVTDSCYYITGIAQDTPNCNLGGLFYKVDTLGNALLHTIQVVENRLDFWRSCLRTDIDGNLVVAGEVFDTTQVSALMIKYNSNGDTLWTRRYRDQANLQGFYRSDNLVITPDSSYILVGQTGNGNNNSFQILNIERDGNIRWSKTIGHGYNYNGEHSLVTLEDGFVVGYVHTNTNQVPIDYDMFCNIKKNDYNGNVLWEWQSDTSLQLEGANDLIQTKDKGWVVGTAIGKEFLTTGGTGSILVHDSYVFKLDSTRNWLWGRKLRAYSYSRYAKVMKVIEQPDSSLMTFGITTDTFPLNGTTIAQWHAMVAKLSPNGDSLWSHRYSYIDQAWAEHEISDVEQTHDGGYLIAGQAKFTGQGPYQQGWLLKLDEHGCLVPGCHIDSSRIGILPIGAQPQAELQLYPNPATDYLNVLYRNQQIGEKLTFRILDEQGRVLQSHITSDVSNKTYVFPVWELLSGWYVLEVRQDGVLVGSEVFIKQ